MSPLETIAFAVIALFGIATVLMFVVKYRYSGETADKVEK